MNYQRFLTPNTKPFDPLELARETETIVTRKGPDGQERKYTGFYSVPVYGGIATGYAAGCCIRCFYCWANWSRDYPDLLGTFYTPTQAAQQLRNAAKAGISSRYWRERIPEVNKLRLSGCEPTIGRDHLLRLLGKLKGSGYPFYLESNGILFGADRSYVQRLAEYAEFIYVRISYKAATPDSFTTITGAMGKYYELPFNALRYLIDEGIYARAAAMTDPRVISQTERALLVQKLDEIDPKARYSETLEEETLDEYKTTTQRMKGKTDRHYAKTLETDIRQRLKRS